jgi:hypothetical protein
VVTDTAYIYHAGTMTAVTGTVGTAAATDAVTTVIYLPWVAKEYIHLPPLTSTTVVTAPLDRVYEVWSQAKTFTQALEAEGDLEIYQYPPSKGYTNIYLREGSYGFDLVSIYRNTLVFDLPEAVRGRRVVTAQVKFGHNTSYYTHDPDGTNEPLWVSESTAVEPASARDAFFGQKGTSWDWMLPVLEDAYSYVPPQTLSIPVEHVDWSGDEVGLFCRSGAEDTRTSMEEGDFFSHTLNWEDEAVPIPFLKLWIEER